MTTREINYLLSQIEFTNHIVDNSILVVHVIDEYYRLWEYFYHPHNKYWAKDLKASLKQFKSVEEIRVYISYSSISNSSPYGYWDCFDYQYIDR